MDLSKYSHEYEGVYSQSEWDDAQAEIAKLKEQLHDQSEYDKAYVDEWQNTINEQAAHIERLRETLDCLVINVAYKYGYKKESQAANKVLDSTPIQSLAKHDRQVVENLLSNIKCREGDIGGCSEVYLLADDIYEYAEQLEKGGK